MMCVRRIFYPGLFILLGLFSCWCLTGCGAKALEYTVKVSGRAEGAGAVEFLDYTIQVYEDEASNSCGSCTQQPVHLYVGADAGETAQAIADAVERADDLWEVASCQKDTVVLREKEEGSVEQISPLSAPEGLSIAGTLSGREVPVMSGSGDGGTEKEESKEVTLSGVPQRLAAVYGPSYELLTMLGAEEKIVVRADVQTADFPWAEKVFGRIAQTPMLNNVHTSVNFEELMRYSPDAVYTFPRQNELEQLSKAGVFALAGQTSEKLDGVKDQVRAYAETLGPDAMERAEEYCQYFDEKMAMVTERTSKIGEEKRPRVYYAGVDILTTYGKYSDLMEVIQAAGGYGVSRDLEAGNRTEIDYEQLMEWDPEVIFIDHGGMNDGETVEELKEKVTEDPIYRELTAVKKGQIHLTPSGVFYWDMGIQKILLVMNMAKILHPEDFEDLDMEAEVMDFYQRFFGYDLTRDEAARILARESPE